MRMLCSTARMVTPAGFLAAAGLMSLAAGCNPYSTAAKIGVKVVGQVVNDEDMAQHSKELLGQPAAAADNAFGRSLRTLEEIDTGRQLTTYPVKDDLLNMFRWAVETENGRIVALAKLQNDPGGGEDIASKLVLTELVNGKTPQEVESHEYFKKRVLMLRDRASRDTFRVYDVAMLPEFTGAKYVVLRFDGTSKCREVRIVGVPSSTSGSSVGN